MFISKRTSGLIDRDNGRDHMRDQFTRQVWNPPLVFLQQVVAKILSDQAQFPHQGADP